MNGDLPKTKKKYTNKFFMYLSATSTWSYIYASKTFYWQLGHSIYDFGQTFIHIAEKYSVTCFVTCDNEKNTSFIHIFHYCIFYILFKCMHACVCKWKKKTYKKPKILIKKKYTCIPCCLLHCFYSYITLQTYFYLIFFYIHTHTLTYSFRIKIISTTCVQRNI